MIGFVLALYLDLVGLAYVHEENAAHHHTGAEKVQLWAYMLLWPVVIPWAFLLRWLDRVIARIW